MKIAILLTGHLRDFQTTWHQWKKLSERHEADFFMHLWDNKGDRVDLRPGEITPELGAYANVTLNQEKIDVNQLVELGIKRENIVLEDYNEVKTKENFEDKCDIIGGFFRQYSQEPPRTMLGVFSQYYKRLKGIEFILAQEQKYDLVLLSRPDFFLSKFDMIPESRIYRANLPVVPELDLYSYNEDKLYLTLLDEHDGYNDFYLIGKPEILKKVCEIYRDNLRSFFRRWKDDEHARFKKLACGHSYIAHWIDEMIKMPVFLIGICGWIWR